MANGNRLDLEFVATLEARLKCSFWMEHSSPDSSDTPVLAGLHYMMLYMFRYDINISFKVCGKVS